MQFIIPTRNNPAALSGLLSSILVCRAQYITLKGAKDTVVIADGSNSPVVAEQHLARLLTMFDVRYSHFTSPHVNEQRLWGLRNCEQDMPAFLLDDDLVMLKDPTAAQDYVVTNKTAIYGTVVDALDDRGYPDYQRVSATPSIHGFYDGQGAYPCEIHHAKPGCMAVIPAKAYKHLALLHTKHPSSPAIADDAWAQVCAEGTPHMHASLMCAHIGNNARWWAKDNFKHAAVKAALDNYSDK